jgi:hypothetical protein
LDRDPGESAPSIKQLVKDADDIEAAQGAADRAAETDFNKIIEKCKGQKASSGS